MPKALMLFIIGLVFGAGAGIVGALSLNVQVEGHGHGDHGAGHDAMASTAAEHDHSTHDHDKLVNVPAEGAPSVSVMLTPDPVSGWNLHVMTRNFKFAPQAAGFANAPGQGHAHVYVDGEKIGRLYGSWMHIASAPEGAQQVSVSLNANDHSQLAVDNVPLIAIVPIPRN